MWILPKQLHTSAFVPDMEGLNLDSNESSQICAQSLFVRSKPSPVRTWSQKWKRNSWTQHLFGRILRPSHGQSFVERWTSSLEVIHANHSVAPASEQARTTQGICGHGLQMAFDLCDQNTASSKTSKDTSRWDSPQSSAIWKKWVTRCRGEYSQRQKLVRATNGQEFSFLPTPCANEDSFRLNGSSQQSKTLEAKARRGELKTVSYAIPVDMVSLRSAGATMENLSVLPVVSGHTHSSMNHQQMDAKSVAVNSQNGLIIDHGPLSPLFVEAMMGLPIGWTDCDSSEME